MKIYELIGDITPILSAYGEEAIPVPPMAEGIQDTSSSALSSRAKRGTAKESLKDAISAKIQETKYTQYEKALYLYYRAKYEEALQIFQANTDDFTSEIMATRCKKIMAGEIEVKDGIYEMKGK